MNTIEYRGITNIEVMDKKSNINLLPLISEEEKLVIEKFFAEHPELKNKDQLDKINKYEFSSGVFDPNEPWIQTYSGQRFTPLNPKPETIVIQDIARALSMQCRFNGHVKEFYSVAQHSVLVSYLCDWKDRLWGLLHDAGEAYISDFSRPLKYSGKFENYREVEAKLMAAICIRFSLPKEEPESVKLADKLLLATEGRDILNCKRTDWFNKEPTPFKISPLSPADVKYYFLVDSMIL